jgi:hypothetical protein
VVFRRNRFARICSNLAPWAEYQNLHVNQVPIGSDGSAELLEDGSIEIEFAYHNGDEAVLKAKLDTSSTAC